MMQIRTNPYRLMNTVFNELERSVSSNRNTDTDVLETNDAVIVQVNLPGVLPENIELSLERNVLTLTTKLNDTPPEGAKFLYRERQVGEQKRVVQIPVRIAADQIEANLEHGVLTVTIAKASDTQAKRIAIHTGNTQKPIQS